LRSTFALAAFLLASTHFTSFSASSFAFYFSLVGFLVVVQHKAQERVAEIEQYSNGLKKNHGNIIVATLGMITKFVE